jgi:hypothetical protein
LETTQHLAAQPGHPQRESVNVSWILHQIHGLNAKYAHSRRQRVAQFGRLTMATAIGTVI